MLKRSFSKSVIIPIILLLIISSAAFPQGEEKKVGLVLSGGGALGIAHIAVLKMIEKYDIPVDYITGTSMGAIIGALYASGYSASEIEEIIKSVNWIPLLSDKKERLSIDIKDRDLFEKNVFSLHFEKGKLVLPEGAIYGQNVYNLLSMLMWHVRETDDFTKLPIPFKCIATDIQTGEAVVLDRGNLADAVRASMAIPSVFSPIEINNRLLVDGGVVRNIPVSDIKRMGADLTIVSDVSTPNYTKEELKSLIAIFDQLIKLTFSTSNEYELSLADRVITYDLKDYSIASFLESSKILEKGEEALSDHEDYFRTLSSELNRKRKIEKPEERPFLVKDIEIQGNKRTDEGKILKNLGITKHREISKHELEKAVLSLYGTGDYNLIRYSAENNILNLNLNEAPPEINSFSLNYNSQESAGISVNSRMRGLFLDSSTARLNFKLGETFLLGADYSIPVLFDLFDFGLKGEYDRRNFYIYNDDGDRESEIYSDFYTASSYLEYSFLKSLKTGLFIDYNLFVLKKKISPDEFDEDIRYFSTGLYLEMDTMNKTLYPDRGFYFYCRGEYVSFDDYFTDSPVSESSDVKDYLQVKVKSDLFIPLLSFLTLKPSVTAGISDFSSSDSAGFFTGGFLDDIDKNFIGFKGIFTGDIAAENIISTEAALNIHLNKVLVMSPFFSRLFYSSSGSMKNIYSFGSSLALITPIGPLEAAFAKAEIKDLPVFYINAGFNF